LVMHLIGLPNPLLWGLMTFAFEFLPYLGGVFMMILLTVSAFATFDSIGRVLLAPGAYLAITTIQNNAVSPFAYGNRLKLNPVVVLLATLVGWFLWGVVGAFVAIPCLPLPRCLLTMPTRSLAWRRFWANDERTGAADGPGSDGAGGGDSPCSNQFRSPGEGSLGGCSHTKRTARR